MVGRCEVCQGRKSVHGLGGIYKICTKCNGVGYISVQEALEPVVEKKKMGRPKKVVSE